MSALTARIAEEYAAHARGSRDAPAVAARRRAALAALEAQGLPTTRDENWKYANLRALERQRFTPAAAAVATPGELPPAIEGFERVVYVDGVRTGPALSGVASADSERAGTPTSPDERLALLNSTFAREAAVVRAAAGPAQRLELLFLASAPAEAGASYPRIELKLDANAEVELIERHLSAGSDQNFVNSAVTAQLGRSARLTHYRLQELNGRSTVFDTLSANLDAQASYRLHAINTGAQGARSTLALRLGERADLALGVAALGDRQQVQDAYAVVEHTAPGAHTEQLFRGIAAGRARVGFNGKIVVAPGARGTDSRQSLRGLLAGAEAEIDVRPQLEIYTDEVRCSHGATAGKLDDNMLFYLLSRGLSHDSAQRLLKWAFLEDVIAQITLPALRRQIEERLAGQLRDDTLRELL
jgi:Fe-S cluster assembly protein SufD